jgi:CRP-like cAMP-binding protein
MKNMILPSALQNLLPPDLQAACEGALIHKNNKVFRAGEKPIWMYYVVNGEVTLERTGLQGEPVVLQRTRSGFISEASLRVPNYHCDACAISDTRVIKVPIGQLALSLAKDSAFARRWIEMLNAEVRRLRLHLERLSMKSIRDRLIHMIETEGRQGSFDTPSGLKTLAGELGVTHEALYRVIAHMEKDGKIRKTKGQLSRIKLPPQAC